MANSQRPIAFWGVAREERPNNPKRTEGKPGPAWTLRRGKAARRAGDLTRLLKEHHQHRAGHPSSNEGKSPAGNHTPSRDARESGRVRIGERDEERGTRNETATVANPHYSDQGQLPELDGAKARGPRRGLSPQSSVLSPLKTPNHQSNE